MVYVNEFGVGTEAIANVPLKGASRGTDGETIDTVTDCPTENPCAPPYNTVAVLPNAPPFVTEVIPNQSFAVLSQTARYPMLAELSSIISTLGLTTDAMKGGWPE